MNLPISRVENTIRSTQQGAHQAVDQLAGGAERLAANVDHLAQRSASLLRDSADQLRERTRRATDSTIVHIRQEPMKAVLIAAALGAAVGVLLTLLGRQR